MKHNPIYAALMAYLRPGAGMTGDIQTIQAPVPETANGTVTSVGLIGPAQFNISGSPVTGAGNITVAFNNPTGTGNLVLQNAPTIGGNVTLTNNLSIGQNVTVTGTTALTGNTSAGNVAAAGIVSVGGVLTELIRASVYVYTGFDPSDVSGTLTNASSTSSATSTAASYITAANSSGTTTWTCVKAGLYRFTVTMQNEQAQPYTIMKLLAALGGTATILLGTPSLVSLFIAAPTLQAPNQLGGSAVFYANMTAGQTVTVLPKIAVTSINATTDFTTQAMVSAEYCGATAN